MTRPIPVNVLANYGIQARRNIEVLAARERMPGGETLRGYCAIASRHLWMMAIHMKPIFCAGLFRAYAKDTAKYHNISGHVWLELDGYIVDITATQFAGVSTKVERDFNRKVYVSRSDNPHYYKTHSGQEAFGRVRNWHEAPLDIICESLPDYTNILATKRKRAITQ